MKKNMNKVLVIVLAVALLAMTIVAGTLAYLMMATDPITNTFTLGNVNITLKETMGSEVSTGVRNFGTILPGKQVAKDPVITVEAGSETCWVFVKVVQTAAAQKYVDCTLDASWVLVASKDEGRTAVYGRETAVSAGTPLKVLKSEGDGDYENGYVTFKTDFDKTEGEVNIIFTAYAIQQFNFADKNAAYDQLQGTTAFDLPER